MGKGRFDWEYWRHRYVSGSESLEELAHIPNAPKRATLKLRCRTEDWTAQRRAFLARTYAKTQEYATTTEAEVAARHAKIAKSLQAKALVRLSRLEIDELGVRDVLAYLKDATEIERKALGLDQLTLNVRGVKSVAKLTDDELEALAEQLGLAD